MHNAFYILLCWDLSTPSSLVASMMLPLLYRSKSKGNARQDKLRSVYKISSSSVTAAEQRWTGLPMHSTHTFSLPDMNAFCPLTLPSAMSMKAASQMAKMRSDKERPFIAGCGMRPSRSPLGYSLSSVQLMVTSALPFALPS